ncbi:MAG: filamentous hemagglutinin N-terminal domain-containing protein [Rubrivivax sp.]|nr:filamentous hemagglutinin N-terminal domain-containing protein [Rubrivivax sp.]
MNCKHRRPQAQQPDPARRLHLNRLALAVALALGGTSPWVLAQALPSGASVVQGQASIVTQGQQMTISNSANAVLNWQSFSIGAGSSVRFEQPSASSQVLNRVLGRDATQIAGRLSSNGGVWLVNPFGVMFGPGARVDVANLVASTLNISDADWQARRYSLLGGPGAGAVTNQGEIRTTLGGHVLLVGGSVGVRNEGLIEADGGQVMLAAGASVDLADSSTPQVAVRLTAPAGEAMNLGRILAAGGRVDLQAAMVNQQGIVRADQLAGGVGGKVNLVATEQLSLAAGSRTSADGGRGGEVVLQAATTLVAGAVSAEGRQGQGGSVKILGERVGLLAGADVSASGSTGGGEILVGGGLQGKDASVPNARAAYVDAGAVLRADAGQRGDGGRIILWSDETTRAFGQFSARGGSAGGDGGFIETSGGWLDARPASVRTDAPHGRAGQWLIDPNNITIGDGVSDVNITGNPDFTSSNDSAGISSATIVAALDAGNNVTITTGAAGSNSESGNIQIALADLSAAPAVPVSLTLTAHGDITMVQSSVSTSEAPLSVTFNAGGRIVIDDSSIHTGGGNITLTGTNRPCGANGCAPFAGADGIYIHFISTLDAGAGTISLRGATAVAGRDGVFTDAFSSPSTLTAGRIDIKGWADPAGSYTAYGVHPEGGLFAAQSISIEANSFAIGTNYSYFFPPQMAAPRIAVRADDITIGYDAVGISATGPGDALTFAGSSGSAARFVNLSGSGTLSAPNGRWLIYATNPLDSANFQPGSLDQDFTQYAATPGTGVRGSGNGFLFSLTPVLTVSGGLGSTATKVYDGTTDTSAGLGEPWLDGFLPGDSLAGSVDFQGLRYASANVGSQIPLLVSIGGPLPPILDSSDRPVFGYVFSGTGPGLVGSITPRQVSVDNVRVLDKVYDGTRTALLGGAAGITGLVAGQSLSLQPGTLAFDTADVGRAKPVTGRFALADGPGGLASNYLLDGGGQVSASADITPKALTLTGASVNDKVYDGSTAATINSGVFGGLIGNQTLSLLADDLRFDTKNVGVDKPVNGSVRLADGSNGGLASNYSLPADLPLALRASITPRPVTLTGVNTADKVYDGSALADTRATGLTGLVAGESLGFRLESSFDTANAGADKPVSVNATLLDGTGGLATNYLVAGGALESRASILPRTVSVQDLPSLDKVYDGTPAVSLAGASLGGLVAGESLNLLPGTVSFDSADAGRARAVTGRYSLADGQGGRAANYVLEGDGQVNTTADINPRPLTLSGARVNDKVYDANTAATLNSGTLSGLVGSQTLNLVSDGLRFDTKDAGIDKAVMGSVRLTDGSNGGRAVNYSLANDMLPALQASITPRPVSVTGLSTADKIYDGSTLADTRATGLTGLLPGENLGLRIDANFDNANAGNAKTVIAQAWLQDGAGGLAANYAVAGGDLQSTASVLPRSVTVQGVMASDKPYDGTTAATLTAQAIVGLVAGETLTLAPQARFDTASVGSAKPVTGSIALADGSGRASNYQLVNPGGFSGTASISQRGLTVTAASAADKVYDGSTTTATANFVLSGVVAGEQVSVASGSGRFADPNVGDRKAVTATATALNGPDAANYTLAQASVQTLAAIAPAPLSYVASALVHPFGIPLPLMTGTVEGLIAGETLASASTGQLSFSTDATRVSPVGTYAVLGSGLVAPNYRLVQAPGNVSALTIAPTWTSAVSEPTSTVPTVPTLLAAVQPVPVVSTPGAGRTMDALSVLRTGSSSVGYRMLDLGTASQQDVAMALAARDQYKQSIFAEAIRELERNPDAANVPDCQTVEQAAAGNCLITEVLKPALRERLLRVAASAPAPASVSPPAAPAPAPVLSVPAPVPAAPALALAKVPSIPPTPSAQALTIPLPAERPVISAAVPQIQRKWALLIGTDVYLDKVIPQLDNAVTDADAVAGVLDSKLGYQSVTVRNGSKAEIVRAFNELAAVVGPSDSVAIYYAGHGDLIEKTGLGYWQPSDASASNAKTWLSNTDIGKLLGQFGASQIVLVSDSCFSGSLVSGERIRASGGAPDVTKLLSQRTAVVMSSGGNEPVFDAGKNGHSAFAWSFMQALEGVSSWRPGSTVFEQVRFAVARQVPQRPLYGASMLGRHQDGGDYVFEQRQLQAMQK